MYLFEIYNIYKHLKLNYLNLYLNMEVQETELLIDFLDNISKDETAWAVFSASLITAENMYDISSCEKLLKHICDIEKVMNLTTLSQKQKDIILNAKDVCIRDLEHYKKINL